MNDLTPVSGADALHARLTVVDGLIVSDFNRAIFQDMRRGGITAANCTCCIWEGFTGTMRNIMQWKQWFRDNDDLILQVHSTADIRRAKAEGKTGIILGWQNITGIEDQIGYLSLFKDLGVGIIHFTPKQSGQDIPMMGSPGNSQIGQQSRRFGRNECAHRTLVETDFNTTQQPNLQQG